MPQQRAVNKAERGMRLEREGEMRVKVDRVKATQAEQPPAPRLPNLPPPERVGAMQRPDRQHGTGGQAGLQHLTTANCMGRLCFHTSPSLRFIVYTPTVAPV